MELFRSPNGNYFLMNNKTKQFCRFGFPYLYYKRTYGNNICRGTWHALHVDLPYFKNPKFERINTKNIPSGILNKITNLEYLQLKAND